MAKKKIKYIISELNIGGAEMILADLAEGVNRDYDVEVIYFTGDAPLLERYTSRKIPVKKFNMTGRFSYKTYRTLIKYLREEKPEIVHTHLYRADIYGVFAAKKAGVPVVISTKHNTDDFRKAGSLWIYFDRKSMKKCSKVIAVSNATRDFFQKYEKADTEK
ncbi:MAG: glycosyltransferase, partial [bacterium]|nr:glycosyltransferase [bacterium]